MQLLTMKVIGTLESSLLAKFRQFAEVCDESSIDAPSLYLCHLSDVLDNVELCRRLKSEEPEANLLCIVSKYHYVKYHAQWVRAGACGFISDVADLDVISRAVRFTSRGHPFIDPDLGNLIKLPPFGRTC